MHINYSKLYVYITFHLRIYNKKKTKNIYIRKENKTAENNANLSPNSFI